MKQCTGECGETKPLDRFCRDSRTADGRRQPCKSCRHEKYMADRETILERVRKYRESNPERVKEYKQRRLANRTVAEQEAQRGYQRQYYEANSERLSERNRQYYLENREKIKAQVKQRRLDDPATSRERARSYRVNETPAQREARLGYAHRWNKENPERATMLRERRRVRQAKVESDGHSIAELHDHWEATGRNPKVCTYCDGPIPNWRRSVGDHVVPISKGGADVLENLVPCCPVCNTSKGNRLLHVEWTPPNMRLRNVS
jgi:5-methylcytosine-specific restriction endonuclease McrA